jgi:threonyl-tRNA synthetase
MIIVYGNEEKETGMLPVRYRDGSIKKYDLDGLCKEIDDKMKGYPFVELTLPRRLSRRVGFRG